MVDTLENTELQYVIDDFSKGLYNSLTDISLPVGAGDIVQNIRFDDVKGIKKRENRAQYNSTTLGTSKMPYSERIYIGSNKYLIIVYGTTLKVGDDSAGTFSNLTTGLTTDLRMTGVTYKDFHYLFNGTDNNIRTDGTAANTKDAGCAAPGAATVAVGAAGALTGDYYYKITFVYDGYQESSGGTASALVQPSSQQVDLSNIPTGASGQGVTARKIYRTTAGGSTYKLVTTISDNTTTTYTDNTADGSLGANVPTDNGTPPVCKFGILHKERIFCAGNSSNKSRLYYSKIASGTSYPDIFPSDNYIDIAPDDGDEIMALAIDPMGTLIVLKRNTIRKVYTDGDPATWQVSDPFSFHGCIASYSVAETPQGVIYLSRSGEMGKELRIFDGQNSQLISERISKELDNILASDISNCVGHYHQNKYLMAYTDYTAGQSYHNRVLNLDMTRDAYSIDIKAVDSFCSWYGSDDWGELYTTTSDTTGFVYREDTKSFDVIHDTKSELDEGTFSQTETTGTEANPELHLVDADLDDDVGAQVVSTLTAITEEVQDYTGDDDTVSPSGTLISDYLEVNASNLNKLYWNESLGTNGLVRFWVRTGDTTGEVDAASWSGSYSTPGGSDISGVSAKKYIQYKVRLYSNDKDTVTTPKLYLASGYVIKIDADLGTSAETAIEFNWRSGQIDCGFPRAMKRFRGIRVEYESDDAGTLTVYYSMDRGTEASFSIALATYGSKYTANFPSASAFGELIRLRLYMNDANNITIKRIILLYTVEPIRW